MTWLNVWACTARDTPGTTGAADDKSGASESRDSATDLIEKTILINGCNSDNEQFPMSNSILDICRNEAGSYKMMG